MAYIDDNTLSNFVLNKQFRDFDGLEVATDEYGQPIQAAFIMEDPHGSSIWIVREVYEYGGTDPIVEFYDGEDTRRNPFVSAYYTSTLEDHEPGTGLDLYGGVASWNISATDLADIKAWM